MARNGTSLEAAHALVKALVAEKLKYLVPMTIIFMVGYVGLTILGGFAKGLMGTKIIGAVNLGFVLIAFNYLLSWVLAVVYGRCLLYTSPSPRDQRGSRMPSSA